MIKAVLFDYGGVLTEGGTAGCVQRLFGQIYGIDPDEMNGDTDIMFKARQGAISEAEFFAEMNRRHPAGPRATPQNYLAASDIFEKSEPVYALAELLRAHAIATGILSNINDTPAVELRKQGFYDGFDPVVLSCEEGCAKPEPEFYTLAVERLGVKPDEIVLVDDQEKCRPPAEAMGMHFILAVSPEQILNDVKALVLKENNLVLE